MAHIVADRVKETTTTTGTGNVTLLGAVAKFLAFSARMANNDTCVYAIVHQTENEWEVGEGTYVSATPALARTTVYASSNSDTAVNFSAGTKDVFINFGAGAQYNFTALVTNGAPLNVKSATPRWEIWETDQAADEIRWRFNLNNKIASWSTITDAGAGAKNYFGVTRGTGTAVASMEIGNSTDLPPVTIWGPIEVGHASDTSVQRNTAGLLQVEGNIIPHLAYAAIWTASHEFNASAAPLSIKNTSPRFDAWETDQAANEQRWSWHVAAKLFRFFATNDATDNARRDVLSATRGTGSAISLVEIGNSTDLPPTTIWGPVNFGHATDTTCQRGAAGELDLEGDRIWNQGNVHTQIGAATEDTTPDGAADFIVTQDVSAGAPKKLRLDKVPGALKRIGITIDGGGSVITTGEKKLTLEPGLTGTIVGWTLAGDQSGSIVMDVWKGDAAIPTNANSITASAKPTLSSVRRGNSTTLTGWTTGITADDVFIFEVESVTSLTHVTLTLLVRATGAQYP